MSEETVEATVVGQSKITARGQITVPRELRKKYGMKAGETLYFLDADGTIILRLGPLIITD